MNHKNTTLAIAAIVSAVAMTAAAFTIPQQALAYRHHHNNSNGIKVDQQIGQTNVCTGAAPPDSEETGDTQEHAETDEAASATVCLNTGNNTANIHG
jgi:hypothetical protein